MRRLLLGVTIATALSYPAIAQDPGTACLLEGPSYRLASDTVAWSMTIGVGRRCIRGLRSAFATIQDVKLLAPPKTGEVTLAGPAFIYVGKADFRGEDSFTLGVKGSLDRIPGSSTINVQVNVR